MFRQPLMMTAGDSDAGGGGNVEKQEMIVNVDGQDVRVKVEPSNENNQAKWTLPDGEPDGAGAEFYTKVSKELQNQYKKNLETAQKLKQQQADLEKQNSNNSTPDLQAKIDNLESLIKGISLGKNLNDTHASETRNSGNDVFDPDAELLRAAGVKDWDEIDDLTPAQIARAQAKVQKLQYDQLAKKGKETEKQYQERLLLTNVQANGFTPDEFKSWATAYNVPITEKSIELFLQIKNTNNNRKKQDEIDKNNEINRIRRSITAEDHGSDSIPDFQFESTEKRAYKSHAQSIRNMIDRNSKRNTVERLRKK
jgi:hypothetical protein